MAAFTSVEYFMGRVPDIQTIIPTFNVEMAVNAAMALYWDRFFPKANPLPDLADDVLSERRKLLCALRAVVSALPMVMEILKPKVTQAKAGPAETKFEERFKLYNMMLTAWKDELTQLEQSEGIVFGLLPNVPAFRLNLESAVMPPTMTERVVERGIMVIPESSL